MKRLLPTIIFLLFAFAGFVYIRKVYYDPKHLVAIAKRVARNNVGQDKLKEGDIIFQNCRLTENMAVQLVGHTPFNHCGLIFDQKGRHFVYEAAEPVQSTPLNEWIARGEGGHYSVKRLNTGDRILAPRVLTAMKQAGERFKGCPYDRYFEWSDDRVYCSELVWKIYRDGGAIELCKPQQLKDFDSSGNTMIDKLRGQYGKKIHLNDTVVSLAAIYESPLLTIVAEK